MSSPSPLHSAPLSRPHLRTVGKPVPRPAIHSAPRDANGNIIFAEPPPPPKTFAEKEVGVWATSSGHPPTERADSNHDHSSGLSTQDTS